MRVALVADWLPTFAGAEHVVAEFARLFPEAPLFTTIARRNALGPLQTCNVRTSALQLPYRLLGSHRMLLPWMPRTMEGIDLRGYDMVLSSSHAVGKGVIPPSDACHICYCHTPMRYAWEMEQQYLEDFRIPKRMRGFVKRKLMELRRWDMVTAKRVDFFIANSQTTQQRIARTYGRESIIIHPPVHDRFFEIPTSYSSSPSLGAEGEATKLKSYYLALGRLVPYKRFDLLIEAANALRFPLKIAGEGPDAGRLRRLAGPTVTLLGYVPDDDLPALYAHAAALLHPQFEDAGVSALEAQACGTPVIAYRAGGALDTVLDGVTGIFFDEQSFASMRDALGRIADMTFDPVGIRAHAEKFRSERFRKEILSLVEKASAQYRSR